MNRNQLRTVLKINGLAEDAPEDEIRAVLMHARYSEDEIDSALVILQSSEQTPDSQMAGLHSVMYTNKSLRANEVCSLLGVDMKAGLPISCRSKDARIETTDTLLIIVSALLLAIIGIILYMFVYEVGFFHPSQ